MAHGLLRRILSHAAAEGWIAPGSVICDPFGGIGSTGLLGAYRGVQVVCVELEPRFCLLAEENFKLHDNAWRKLDCPRPVMICGDSRDCCRIIEWLMLVRKCTTKNTKFARLYKFTLKELGKKFNKHPCTIWEWHNKGILRDKLRGVDCIISSPPYEEGLGHDTGYPRLDATEDKRRSIEGCARRNGYGQTPGNLGNSQGDTFWSAAKIICEQCYQILKPGGVAIWVVKAFVRKGKLVDFPGDWRRLCESIGFTTLHEHHAMLVKEERYTTLFGDEVVDRTKSASFFRFIYEAKTAWKNYWATLSAETQAEYIERAEKADPELHITSPLKLAFDESGEDPNDWNEDVRIDYETVLCMQK